MGGLAIFTLANHGPTVVIKALKSALGTQASPELSHSYQVLQNMRRTAMASGIIGGLVGLAIVLKYGQPETAKLMGPGMAVGALSMLYGLIISELLVGPMGPD